MFSTWSIPNSAYAPDVILEVGLQPCCSRFAAHGSLLAIHSGYLRAALRTVDQSHTNATAGSSRQVAPLQHTHITASTSTIFAAPSGAAGNAGTTLLYLPNVTPEQFTPLLSYMYTGYLDLTVNNIFGILLATHLLHMPRALELCRTFLSSSTATVTTSANSGGLAATTGVPLLDRSYHASKTHSDVPRLVRPIASKPLASVGMNFIAPPTASQIHLLPSAYFRRLGSPFNSSNNGTEVVPQDVSHRSESRDSCSQSPISVTEYEDDNVTIEAPQLYALDNADSMNNAVVDMRGHENENKPKLNNDYEETLEKPEPQSKKMETITNYATTSTSIPLQHASTKQQTSIEVPTTVDSRNGVIVDIASCDGPVRFRRVLNVMYGCNKSNRSSNTASMENECLSDRGEGSKKVASYHRSMRYASSFHQQMARNISDTEKLTADKAPSSSSSYRSLHCHPHFQRKQLQVGTFENQDQQHEHDQQKDENSQDDNTSYHNEDTSSVGGPGSLCYTCVYCKHSFKSHYCYQKHAKRHLIPLRTDAGGSIVPATTSAYQLDKAGSGNTFKQVKTVENDQRRSQTSSIDGSNSSSTIKREEKPLDMNVQYYPCKTCGSKFPSYYFVHKHRKLCHAEEEDDTVSHGNSNINGPTYRTSQAGSSKPKLNLAESNIAKPVVNDVVEHMDLDRTATT